MRKRLIAFLLACLLAASVTAAAADGQEVDWTEEKRSELRVGNPTPLQGRFFTTLWGGTTSDLDVQDLLHDYSPVLYDTELSKFRFDHSVVQEAVAVNNEDGSRTYLLVFYDDLRWSDGTPITAADYAFTILFCMDRAVAETGGTPADYSWIEGADEYLDGTSPCLSGLRILSDVMLQIRVKAEALPYFYELSRLSIHPSPAPVIAPGITAVDDGEGARFSESLTAEMIREYVLDPDTGYLSHPSPVSGPYVLTGFDGVTAVLEINPYFKGTEQGLLPEIGRLEYTAADNATMMDDLFRGDFGLLSKVTLSENIQKGIRSRENGTKSIMMENYARSGLTILWYMESSLKVQETDVRRAIACCFDREGFTREYAGPYGVKMDAFCGIGQWMFRLASGQIGAPVDGNLSEAEQEAEAEAYAELTLDGLAVYDADPEEAERLLDAAGWKRNAEGIRTKQVNGETVELRLVLGLPESDEAEAELTEYFVRNLEAAGFAVTLRQMAMDELESAYEGGDSGVDLLYLGEDFTITFDPAILAPAADAPENAAQESLPAVKKELYALAEDMVRTEPDDLRGFLAKWITLQERITETLPLLPVYSNVYFDFFTRQLHEYRITRMVSWGKAIVGSIISDAEVPGDEEIRSLQELIADLDARLSAY